MVTQSFFGIRKPINKETDQSMPVRKKLRTKGRSLKTYKNKLRKLEKRYNNLFQKSKEAKEKCGSSPVDKETVKKKPFFCDKYPDLNSFLKVNNIKEATK